MMLQQRDLQHPSGKRMSAESTIPDTRVRADEVSSIAEVLPQILNVLQSAVVVFDTDAMLRYSNERARNVFVIDPRAPSVSQSARVVLGDLAETLLPIVARVRSTGIAETTPIQLASDGRWFDMRVTPFISDLVFVGGTDVTARELRRATLEQSEQLLRAIFELMPTSVRVSDLAGQLEQVANSDYAEHWNVPSDSNYSTRSTLQPGFTSGSTRSGSYSSEWSNRSSLQSTKNSDIQSSRSALQSSGWFIPRDYCLSPNAYNV